MPKRIIPKSKTATQDRKQSFSSLKLSQGSQGSDLENISNEDKIAQFEVEVRWCIQQLENALKLGKLSPKQVKDHKVCLSTLKSSTSSMVQKRQVMSVSFGNYREKMAAEEKKIIRGFVNVCLSEIEHISIEKGDNYTVVLLNASLAERNPQCVISSPSLISTSYNLNLEEPPDGADLNLNVTNRNNINFATLESIGLCGLFVRNSSHTLPLQWHFSLEEDHKVLLSKDIEIRAASSSSPESESEGSVLASSTGLGIGLGVGFLFIVIVIGGVTYWKRRNRRNGPYTNTATEMTGIFQN